jgi:hypothetical protein
MAKLKTLRRKFKHGLLLNSIFRRFRSIGLTIEPYIIYREPLDNPAPVANDGCIVTVVRASDVDRIFADFPDESRIWKKTWLRRLENDEVGLLLTDSHGVAGFTWANIHYCTDPLGKKLFKLEDKEAYLHDMVIARRARGQNLAGFLRAAMHRELQSRARTIAYSISSYFNTPAIRFKKKLSSVRIELRCGVIIGQRNLDFRMRRYSRQTRQFDYMR